MRSIIVFLALAIAAASASRVFLETPHAMDMPHPWTVSTLRPSENALRLSQREIIVAIKQQNTDVLERLFWEVSDPKSPKFRQYLTIDEITEIIAPKDESVEKTMQWVRESGGHDLRLTRNRDYLKARISLFDLEPMLNVTFLRYAHPERRVLATLDAYSVPAEMAEHVTMISYVTGLPDIHLPKKVDKHQYSFAAGDLDITPDVIRARYNCSDWKATATNNSLAVAEFQAQYFSQSDLNEFFQTYVPSSPVSAATVAHIIGTNNDQSPGIEASLDIEYIMGVAPGVEASFYSQYQFNFYNDLINWLTILDNSTSIPWVHSVSYGSQGNYPSSTYMAQSDTEYQKLGLRGVSIIYASGDSGAECENFCSVLYPSYPAISVYVTSIGSTKFQNGNSGPEAATTSFRSGGGFSDYNVAPSYQSAYTSAYLASTSIEFPPTGSYNASGRGTPDFAALGDEHFQVIVSGHTVAVGGTSASAPSFAAVMVMLNDALLNANKPTLGFLNPTLYDIAANVPGAFFDVTIGDNEQGCGNSCAPNIDGFQCTTAWDAVTGFGTPNFAVLVNNV
jgi:tripeptidyl-peptidase I